MVSRMARQLHINTGGIQGQDTVQKFRSKGSSGAEGGHCNTYKTRNQGTSTICKTRDTRGIKIKGKDSKLPREDYTLRQLNHLGPNSTLAV